MERDRTSKKGLVTTLMTKERRKKQFPKGGRNGRDLKKEREQEIEGVAKTNSP